MIMIRKANEKDLFSVLKLEKELFLEDAWTEQMFIDEMNKNPYACLYVYEIDSEIVGYFDLLIAYENAEIANIGVSKLHQHEGIGTKMMEFIDQLVKKSCCEEFTLEVRMSNENAIHLYEKFGFKIVSSRKNYYADGEDAYLMYKN